MTTLDFEIEWTRATSIINWANISYKLKANNTDMANSHYLLTNEK